MSKITDLSKTIIALATALGSGSIAIIRVSGNNAIKIDTNIIMYLTESPTYFSILFFH